MLLLIKYTLLYGIVLMLVALGGMFSEHSGIINIALEGIMVIGGVAGVLTLTMLPASLSPFLVVLISILVAARAGGIYSLLLAFASINLKADQTIGGPALNLLATAIAVVISKYFSESGSAKLNYSNKPFLFSIGGLELSGFVDRKSVGEGKSGDLGGRRIIKKKKKKKKAGRRAKILTKQA